MIIVRSPLRISFFGGGTDIPDYYHKDYGCVLGQAIDKYVYVILNNRFENNIRISYLKNEIVSKRNQIKHKLIKESLKEFDVKNNIEVVTIGDIPGTGTGLGSSSSLSVGLCNSLSLFTDRSLTRTELAEKACMVEIDRLQNPIGKQDQYFSTFGGVLFIRFEKDERVIIERLNLKKKIKHELEENLLGFYTGIPRDANAILQKQNTRTKMNMSSLDKIRDLAENARDFLRNNDLASFSELFNDSWELKKSLLPSISNSKIDLICKKAIKSGATGGKLSGAGGGGFMFFYCEPRFQKRVRDSLKNLTELDFKIDDAGSIQLH